ncbi:amino acid ABC transporter substrate-binding protein [Niallia taxi]|uniref:Amino acid ABC transporter substrate-binding protein n=1 Tax=Niallia taxi TaxID=2499688 RepID=A0A3S3SIT2_9BACI|nr:amino acid ABC transporter substrate-binding protein [Niallia taxi]MCM3216864.1 amino acid ABC transporter substrate-binding protein [Niallia taxi]MCT2347473.1 amino acid ABC transporter substrate-binding protein [Niallia taxi]MDK8643485.1 amino acid ABC transporter substrate-binding protein [Niallia taxi]MED3962808.1 amino acid ABC transporter substrate-binding protein [Niallia taxi]MED4039760.1 amino acid ABC transporter substrate-binding protein [Niallia taxi]
MKRLLTMILLVAAVFSIVAGCSKSSSKEDDTLVIGIDDKFAPMGFRDENNEIVGFDIDYAKAAAEKMDMKVEFQPIDWETKESELSSGRIDLIWNGYTITDERKKKVLFTKPYLKNAQVVVTLADSKVTKLADLEGKVVGLQSLSSAADALDADPIKSKIKTVTEFSDNVSALNDLKNGRLDAVVIDEIVIDYYMTKEEGSFKILDESLAPEEYGVGVKKGNEELLEKLQKALDEMNEDGTAAEISDKWFGDDIVIK